MTSEYISPLNLKYIFENVFAGSPNIFSGIFFIGMAFLAGIFKMRGDVFLILIALSGIILFQWFGSGFYVFILVVASLILYFIISKLMKN